MKSWRLVPVLFLLAASSARASLVFQSNGAPVRLLELYSSEGCSSCPPAEAWLSEMKSSGDLWKKFVPVVWHVDYWDQLGWRDGFGSRNYSIRQKSEGTAVGTTSYTPGFFLNGAEWRGFFDGNALPPNDGANPGLLRATQTAPREFIVSFTPTGLSDQPLDINGALLGMGLTSDVDAGENRGKKLTHDFTVLGSVSRTVDAHNGTYTVRMELPEYCSVKADRLAAAFWVAPAGGFTAIQATGGFLPEEIPDDIPDAP